MMIDQILEFNKSFVTSKAYEQYVTDKYPDKKLAVLSCMDTRLTELLPAALGLKNGDAKIIKNAGGLVISPFDSALRSLVVAIYELGVDTTTCSFARVTATLRRRSPPSRLSGPKFIANLPSASGA